MSIDKLTIKMMGHIVKAKNNKDKYTIDFLFQKSHWDKFGHNKINLDTHIIFTYKDDVEKYYESLELMRIDSMNEYNAIYETLESFTWALQSNFNLPKIKIIQEGHLKNTCIYCKRPLAETASWILCDRCREVEKYVKQTGYREEKITPENKEEPKNMLCDCKPLWIKEPELNPFKNLF